MSKKTSVAVAAAVLFALVVGIPPALSADVSLNGPYLGRTNDVTVERRQYGDVIPYITLRTRIHDQTTVTAADVLETSPGNVEVIVNIDSPAPTSTQPSYFEMINCDGGGLSQDPTCAGIRSINSCNWNSLTQAARTALTTVLGSCTKVCNTAFTVQQWGEGATAYQWQCQVPTQAECVLVTGVEDRVDLVRRENGCQ